MSEFKHEIENAGLNHMLDNELSADPNFNYEILAKVLQSAKVKHIPKVTKKFNKRKHKREKWMTDELLKLVVRKNELYVEWKTTAVDDPLFEQRKRNFRTYDNMIKGTDQAGIFMSLKCVIYYANYRSWHQSSKIQVVS